MRPVIDGYWGMVLCIAMLGTHCIKGVEPCETECGVGQTCTDGVCLDGDDLCDPECDAGETCAQGECRTNTCLLDCGAGGTCLLQDHQANCVCGTGFALDANGRCRDVDECTAESEVCALEAQCTNSAGGFGCTCNEPWVGDGFDCTHPCAFQPPLCQNGGTCVEQSTTRGYRCDCPPDFRGLDCGEPEPTFDCATTACDDKDPCTFDSCDQAQGCVFSVEERTVAGAVLVFCPQQLTFEDAAAVCESDGLALAALNSPGLMLTATTTAEELAMSSLWIGLNDINGDNVIRWRDGDIPAAVQWCSAHSESSSLDCAAIAGNCLENRACSETHGFVCGPTIPCASNPCLNGGTCSSSAGVAECSCTGGWTGDTCETPPVDPCASTPCLNGGTCSSPSGSAECSCIGGWTGETCELPPAGPCVPNPCKNGGTCSSPSAIAECSCINGWTGSMCETPPDPCATNPCLNGGTCSSPAGSAECACIDDWTGAFCETPSTDPCALSPCLNGGLCSSPSDTAECECPANYTGVTCETLNPGGAPQTCDTPGETCSVSACPWPNGGCVCKPPPPANPGGNNNCLPLCDASAQCAQGLMCISGGNDDICVPEGG